MTLVSPASGRKRYTSVWDALGDPQIIASILILYCLIHFLVRLLLSPNYTLDESEQILFGQSLEWGYRFRHPPLITWLSWGTLTATGQSRVAFFLLKYLLMLWGLLAYFQAARLVIRDDRLAGLAVFGLLTTFVMGYMPHIDLMHTVLLATMLAAYLWADARALTSGRWRDYALLGVIAGLGILSKYIFLVLPIAMAIATMLVPRMRARVKLWPTLLAVVIALAIVAPYAWWAKTHEYSLFTLAQTITKSSGPALDLAGWFKGTGNLVVALLGFALPLIAIFPIFYWKASQPIYRANDIDDRDWLKLYGLAMLAGIVIMWLAVFVVGTEAFKSRWMHQVLLPLPIWLFLRVKMAGASERSNKLFMWSAAILALGVLVARVAIYETDAAKCKSCREYWPMQTYARDFRRMGFTGGTVVAASKHADEAYDLAGNLRGVLPEARVLTPGYPPDVFGPRVPGECLLVWEGDGDVPKDLLAYFEGPMGLHPGPDRVTGNVYARMVKGTRMHQLSYLYEPKCVAGTAK